MSNEIHEYPTDWKEEDIRLHHLTKKLFPDMNKCLTLLLESQKINQEEKEMPLSHPELKREDGYYHIPTYTYIPPIKTDELYK